MHRGWTSLNDNRRLQERGRFYLLVWLQLSLVAFLLQSPARAFLASKDLQLQAVATLIERALDISAVQQGDVTRQRHSFPLQLGATPGRQSLKARDAFGCLIEIERLNCSKGHQITTGPREGRSFICSSESRLEILVTFSRLKLCTRASSSKIQDGMVFGPGRSANVGRKEVSKEIEYHA